MALSTREERALRLIDLRMENLTKQRDRLEARIAELEAEREKCRSERKP